MLEFIKGDLFKNLDPEQTDLNIIIPHVCNDIGGWGAGFVVPLGITFPKAQTKYRRWFRKGYDSEQNIEFNIGETQFADVNPLYGPEVLVANMIAQRGTISVMNPMPLSYKHLSICLNTVAERVLEMKKMVDRKTIIKMPMFGCGLAGGNWDYIQTMVEMHWLCKGIDVQVYSID